MELSYVRYKEWLQNCKASNCNITQLAWAYLCGDDPDEFSGVCGIMWCVLSSFKRQNALFCDVVKQHNGSKWQEYLSVCAQVIYDCRHLVPTLREKKRAIGQDEFWKYLYTLISRVKSRCIAQYISSICNPITTVPIDDPEGIDTSGIIDGSPDNAGLQRMANKSWQEMMSDHTAQCKACELSDLMRDEWSTGMKNVLCQLCEEIHGISSRRLMEESRDYIYKLRERLRKALQDLRKSQGYDGMSMRIFFRKYLPEICQETPITPRYKIKSATLAEER